MILKWGLNQMTMRNASVIELLNTAKRLGCEGIELRNDLGSPLFDGMSLEQLRDEVKRRGLRILGLAEVYGFNGKDSERIRAEVRHLCAQANSLRSEAIVLIPEIFKNPVDQKDQLNLLRVALDLLKPIIEKSGVIALIEPLGFFNSSLQLKADAVRVLDEMGRPACYALVHDTFHHALSGEVDVFGDLTRVVHISGVDDHNCATHALTDAH
ncbi:MAG: TIM barrel protein, partial [Paracoccaceae bacterium]